METANLVPRLIKKSVTRRNLTIISTVTLAYRYWFDYYFLGSKSFKKKKETEINKNNFLAIITIHYEILEEFALKIPLPWPLFAW